MIIFDQRSQSSYSSQYWQALNMYEDIFKLLDVLNPRIQKLYEAQKEITTQLLQTAKQKIAESNAQEGGIALFRAYRESSDP